MGEAKIAMTPAAPAGLLTLGPSIGAAATGAEKSCCSTCGRRQAVRGTGTLVPLTFTATTGAGVPRQQH